MDHFDKRQLKKGEVLIKEGEPGNDLYLLTQGCLKVYKDKKSTQYEVATIFPGQVVGEMSFLDNKPRSASVKATKDTTVAIIPRAYYQEFLQTLPDWLLQLQATILSRLREANKKIII